MKVSRKLSGKDKEDLLLSLCQAVASVKNPSQAAELIRDIFTENEAEVIAKRIEIARLLISGNTFDEITSLLKVSKGTISRVSVWLAEGGEGIRRAVHQISKKKMTRVDKESWGELKRRYPMYYWPEILLEEIVASANKKEKERILSVLGKVKVKSQLYRNLSKILKEQYTH